MMRKNSLLFVLTALWLLWAALPVRAVEAPVVIPRPVEMVTGTGQFVLKKNMKMSLPAYPGDSVRAVADAFAGALERATGIRLSVTPKEKKAHLRFTLDAQLPPEGYRLDVTSAGVCIEASRPAGFFYALQTLKQLLPCHVRAGVPDPAVTTWVLPVVHIADEPRFGWRGFMLDEGRHFFGKEEVKRVLDIMATYKMNRFHWHLTEDQGWRLEIPKWPRLTEVGARRNSRGLGWGDVKPDGQTYEGYYTRDDVREIVDYARERFIEILPEVDIPGHSQAAVAAYPAELACDPDAPHEVWLWQGVSTDVINVANPQAVQFAKDVVDELIALFPFGYIHLGGDECPTQKWERNEACRAQLAALGSDNYRDLQINFYKQLQDYIQANPAGQQRQLVFWNEVLHGNTDRLDKDGITIMAWVGANQAALHAAQQGMDNILSPQIPYYINRKQSAGPDEPLSQGGGTETVKAVYDYEPARGVPPELLPRYTGVQANFWTEWVDDPAVLEYLMLPRLAAVAEAGWTPQSLRQYDDFVRRIRREASLYDLCGWRYGKHVME